jgi:acetylornithine deacetylase
MHRVSWTGADEALLLRLLAVDTTSPMETGAPSDLAGAQRILVERAAELGFRVVHEQPPPIGALDEPGTPLAVREAAAAMGPATFAQLQPNVVLRLGADRGGERTVVFNCHLDTVSGVLPVSSAGGVVTGRGSVDAKGQAVAVLAGVRSALASRPDLAETMTVLLHLVGGEEGGAMGWYGTRLLVRAGFTGRLTVVAEPTRLAALDRTTATMTARVRVNGDDATDDAAASGHNATLALAVVAQALVRRVGRCAAGTLCLGGLHTGTMHNRVYGRGTLLANLAYGSAAAAARLRAETEGAFDAAMTVLEREFRSVPVAARTARDARRICELDWTKEGLPVLSGRDAEMERLLAAAGIDRHDERTGLAPFTCDAMWFGAAGGHTVVLGAGDLDGNGAHTRHEHVRLSDLAAYAARIAALLTVFQRSDQTAGAIR